jgi:hypothetical protein
MRARLEMNRMSRRHPKVAERGAERTTRAVPFAMRNAAFPPPKNCQASSSIFHTFFLATWRCGFYGGARSGPNANQAQEIVASS